MCCNQLREQMNGFAYNNINNNRHVPDEQRNMTCIR